MMWGRNGGNFKVFQGIRRIIPVEEMRENSFVAKESFEQTQTSDQTYEVNILIVIDEI
jgi:hypothetical protein